MTGFDWVDFDLSKRPRISGMTRIGIGDLRFEISKLNEGSGGRGFVEGGFEFNFFGQVGSGCRDGGNEGFTPGTGLFEFGFEFFTDVRAFGPFPELVLAGFVGLGGLESEALLFDGDAAGIEVAAAERDDIGGDVAELAEVSFGFIVGGSEIVSGGGEVKGDPVNEFVGEIGGGAGFGGRSIDEGFCGEGGSVLTEFPTAEAVSGPFMQVLLGDGAPGEVGSDKGTNFGQGIEPGEDTVVALAIIEAAVELFTDRFGEMGDFAIHSFWHESNRGRWTNTVYVGKIVEFTRTYPTEGLAPLSTCKG